MLLDDLLGDYGLDDGLGDGGLFFFDESRLIFEELVILNLGILHGLLQVVFAIIDVEVVLIAYSCGFFPGLGRLPLFGEDPFGAPRFVEHDNGGKWPHESNENKSDEQESGDKLTHRVCVTIGGARETSLYTPVYHISISGGWRSKGETNRVMSNEFRMLKMFLLIILILGCIGGIFLLQSGNFFGAEENDTTRGDDVASVVAEDIDDEIAKEVILVELESVPPLLPEAYSIPDVPFTVQAPSGQWGDPIFQDACEEASVIMAEAWVRGSILTPAGVTEEIGQLAAWQKKIFGHSVDTSITDTARMLKEYYGVTAVSVETAVTLDAIQRALASDQVVIVPTDGRKLKNPNFTAPGPPRHMLVIVGYDTLAGEFITNDPGTRRGEGYRYPEATLYDAILDYPTGRHAEATSTDKVMLTVGRD